MNIQKELKEIFEDTDYNLTDFKLYVEFNQQKLELHLFNKKTMNKVKLELNIDYLDAVKDTINDIIKLS